MGSNSVSIEACPRASNHDNLRLLEAEHRHANTLQLLSSLVRRSLKDAEGEEAREVLGFVCDLIDTMIALHKISHDSEDDLAVLMRGMVSQWQRSCNGNIRIVTEVEEGLDMPKTSQTIVILIAQELVMHAIKNAFPDWHSGTIWIRVYSTAPNDVTLDVDDDGVGSTASGSETAETAATRHANTLVRDLALTLGGTMRRDQVRRGTGRCISVCWPA